jgi:hypothetical protein
VVARLLFVYKAEFPDYSLLLQLVGLPVLEPLQSLLLFQLLLLHPIQTLWLFLQRHEPFMRL